ARVGRVRMALALQSEPGARLPDAAPMVGRGSRRKDNPYPYRAGFRGFVPVLTVCPDSRRGWGGGRLSRPRPVAPPCRNASRYQRSGIRGGPITGFRLSLPLAERAGGLRHDHRDDPCFRSLPLSPARDIGGLGKPLGGKNRA